MAREEEFNCALFVCVPEFEVLQQQIAITTGCYDLYLGTASLASSPASRVCAYCGTKNQVDRCESCGAPER